jgi:hypothetical protein
LFLLLGCTGALVLAIGSGSVMQGAFGAILAILGMSIVWLAADSIVIYVAGKHGRRGSLGRRAHLTFAACILILTSAIGSAWPLRLSFLASRSRLDAIADKYEAAGDPVVHVDHMAGAFPVKRIGRHQGFVYLITGPDTGFVRVNDKSGFDPEHAALWWSINLGSGWYWVAEE